MKSPRIVAIAVACAMASGLSQTAVVAQQSVVLAGTARDEAKSPFPDFSVRARNIQGGQILGTSPLDRNGAFTLRNLTAANYVVELVDRRGDIICTEGPFDMRSQVLKNDIVINCGNGGVAAWWTLSGAFVANGVPGQNNAGQQNAMISGTAKDEAKQPYTEYSVRARDMQEGQIAGTATLDNTGAFALASLTTAKYLVELLNKDGKVVCTEGPFDMASQVIKDGVVIDCNKIPAAWWILGAAAAAGVTAGVVAVGPASASR